MKFIPARLPAAAATLAVLAVAAPISSASADGWPFGTPNVNTLGGLIGPDGCGQNLPSGIGTAGGTTAQTCGVALSFIGPAIGQVANVVGPTIIAANVTLLAPISVSAGPVQN